MKRNIALILTILTLALSCGAQNRAAQAAAAFDQGDYTKAYSIYSALLTEKPNDAALQFGVGRTLCQMHRYQEAIAPLEYAAMRNNASAHYYLYCAYFNTFRFDKAATAMQIYIDLRVAGIDDEAPYQQAISKAQLGMTMINRIEDIAIIDSVKVAKTQFLSAYRLSSDLGQLELGSSDRGQTSAFTSGRRDRMIYSAYAPTQGLDLYVSYRLPDGWTRPSPLALEINSEYNENYPFQMPDGITLYFASQGHNSLGGYDIFMTRYNSESREFTTPVNLGMPFNSPANDYMLVVDEQAGIGWFATDRFQHPDTVVVYEFQPNAERLLFKTDDPELRRTRAALITTRPATYVGTTVVETKTAAASTAEINFFVNDDVIYTALDQFISADAKALYLKAEELDHRLSTQLILLEGKRREYRFSDDPIDKEAIRKEIIDLELDIDRQSDLVKEYILQTRRAEIKAIEENTKKK